MLHANAELETNQKVINDSIPFIQAFLENSYIVFISCSLPVRSLDIAVYAAWQLPCFLPCEFSGDGYAK